MSDIQAIAQLLNKGRPMYFEEIKSHVDLSQPALSWALNLLLVKGKIKKTMPKACNGCVKACKVGRIYYQWSQSCSYEMP